MIRGIDKRAQHLFHELALVCDALPHWRQRCTRRNTNAVATISMTPTGAIETIVCLCAARDGKTSGHTAKRRDWRTGDGRPVRCGVHVKRQFLVGTLALKRPHDVVPRKRVSKLFLEGCRVKVFYRLQQRLCVWQPAGGVAPLVAFNLEVQVRVQRLAQPHGHAHVPLALGEGQHTRKQVASRRIERKVFEALSMGVKGGGQDTQFFGSAVLASAWRSRVTTDSLRVLGVHRHGLALPSWSVYKKGRDHERFAWCSRLHQGAGLNLSSSRHQCSCAARAGQGLRGLVGYVKQTVTHGFYTLDCGGNAVGLVQKLSSVGDD
jgi:hypothetical protein